MRRCLVELNAAGHVVAERLEDGDQRENEQAGLEPGGAHQNRSGNSRATATR